MRKFKLALLIGIFLSALLVISCSSPSGGGDPDKGTVTVTFYDVDSTEPYKTVTFDSGEPLSRYSLTFGPFKSYNTFLCWSESKESFDKMEAFDFDKPVTKNTILYAIYTPDIYSSDAITSLLPTKIIIKLYGTTHYPLEDGSYAGLKFTHSIDYGTEQNLSVENIPSDVTTDTSYTYLTYSFKNRLSPGTHSIKVTDGYYISSKEITVKDLTNPVTVIFDDNGSTVKIAEFESGEALSSLASSELPSTPSKSYNYFMYWSESKASQAAAVEFDFATPVTEDKTLYAIYTPKLSLVNDLSATSIEIKLSDDKVYPLEDGSYAGVKFSYSATGSDDSYEEIDLSIPSGFRDASTYRYVTYTFDTPLSAGKHYFKVSNGHDTISKNITISEPAPVTNLAATVADSYVNISFTPIEGYSSYTVKAYNSAAELASQTIYAASSSAKNAEFFGLENGTEYTFKVFTDGTDKSAEITATPEITQKESDWLLVMYMDGDNNLHQPIYIDMNEAEYGLYKARNVSGSDSVNVVALWDGVVSYQVKDNSGQTVTLTPQIGDAGSYLYELGTDTSATANYITDPGCVLSSNTKNLSYTAPWLVEDITVSTTESGFCGEVNMGDVQTLTNYLNWVNAHYKANKGIILQFSNHGGGPRSIKLDKNYERRSMCWDDTSGDVYFLKTSDVSKALKDAGFGTSNKVKMIMEDVCLGGSLEEAYELKDYAEYYIGSPNNIPGAGFDYVSFVSSLTKNATIEEIGGKLIKSYKSDYTATTSDWNDFFAENPELNINDDNYNIAKSVYNTSLATLSFIDLSKIEAVKTAVEEYASLVKAATEDDEMVKVGTDGKYYVEGQGQTIPENATFVSITEAVKYHTAYFGDPIYYDGTFGSLKDLGFMSFSLNVIYAQTTNTTWLNILTKANAITAALNDAIIACWRDGYKAPTYYKNPQDSNNSKESDSYYGNSLGLGLTINCSCWVPHAGKDGKDYLYEDFADWYQNELAFGKECTAWTNLIKEWFSWED